MPPNLTAAQRRAVASSGDVLVMAGAGAGKTSTLIERILNRVLDAGDRVSLDRLLVVTFNEAAAAEMRHRLRRALSDRRQAAPDDAWVGEQEALLETALVSTLHGFCLRLIREHFHELGLDPQFAVQDPIQTQILRHQVLGEVMSRHYAGIAPRAGEVQAFLRRHAPDGDGTVRRLVLRVHDYARSLPDAAGWRMRIRDAVESPSASEWRALLVPGIREWAAGWRKVAEGALSDPDNFVAQETAAALARAESADSAGMVEVLQAVGRAGDKTRFGKGQPGYRKMGAWREPLEEMLDEAEELGGFLGAAVTGGADPLELDWSQSRDDVGALVGLVEQFDAAFTEARRAAAAVDFADLEQLALRLLWNPGAARPTALALRWRERLEHVFVDEYQDINEAQDRIIRCVSREGAAANRFFVGDVKQSIYRFRRAAPHIFQAYAAQWRGGEGTSVVPLVENFRSHAAILGFVNELFGRLMRPAVGGVAYDAEARLLFGAPDTRMALRERPEGRVELNLLVTNAQSVGAEGGEDEPGGETLAAADLDAEEQQAAIAASRLTSLHTTREPVWDPRLGAHRPVEWRDMVVLHPSPGPVAERWARQFMRAGVPFEARRGGFFRALEVADLVNLARLLDNPLQDLPLLAVLRSPLVGLTVDELVIVRLIRRTGRYWEAVERCAAGVGGSAEWGDDLQVRAAVNSARGRLRWFLERFRRWRELAREGAVSRCLEKVLADASYEAWLRAQPRAEARLANVRRLLGLTRQFDQFQRRGLFRFLRFVEAQEETGEELESARAAAGDSVRFLSMHQSKGLEFPVVVAAGLGRKFNLRDLREEWLLDEVFGLCPPVLPPGRSRGHPSLPRWLAGRRQLREALGEQIRLFYVACTRAADRLILMGSVQASRLSKWNDPAAVLTDRDVLRAGEALAWLGPLIPALTGESRWGERESGTGFWLAWRLHLENEAAGPTGSSADGLCESPAVAEPDPAQVEAVRARLGWQYPWTAATRESAKTAVTALRRRWAAEVEEAEAVEEDAWVRPVCAPGHGARAVSADAVARGMAHHLFFELLDVSATTTRASIEAEKLRLLEEGWLAREQADLLDLDGVAAFWSTEVGERIRSTPGGVQRELPFTIRLRSREARLLGAPTSLTGVSDDDFQVVQGVADLVLFLSDEIWLVDYKTDRILPDAVEARGAEYGAQLRLYAHALAAIYRRPVTRRFLWFIEPRRMVEVK